MTKAESTGYQRTLLVKDYLASGLSLAQFCSHYNAQLTAGRLEQVALRQNLSAPTLSRWAAAYKDGGPQALRPRYQDSPKTKGPGATLTPSEKQLLQKYWLHQNKPGVAACCRWIHQQHGIDISCHIARRYLNSLPESLKIMRREGPNAYNAKVNPAIAKDYTRLEVMQQICPDHHTLDLMCVEKIGDKPFRPYLTAYIDMRSRKLLSWAINKHQPDQWIVMEVLNDLIAQHGLPQCIIMDNGKDFISKNFIGSKVPTKCHFDSEVEIEIKGIFAELGCDVVRTTPYHGQAKWIERLFGFICEDFSKQFDTYTGSNTVSCPEEKALYHCSIGKQAQKHVMLTLAELRSCFGTWAAWYNSAWHQNGSGMEGRTADQVFALRSHRTSMPAWLRERIFCRTEKRTVTKQGVQLTGIQYYSPELIASYLRNEVIVKRPFQDTSKVFVYSLKGSYLGEALSYEDIGLAETGDTERDIAAKQRLAKQVKKTAKAYEEALSTSARTGAENTQRRTIHHQHQHPMHQKLRVTAMAAGAEDLQLPQIKKPLAATSGKNILNLIGDQDYEDYE